jgi:hypothetical protein
VVSILDKSFPYSACLLSNNNNNNSQKLLNVFSLLPFKFLDLHSWRQTKKTISLFRGDLYFNSNFILYEKQTSYPLYGNLHLHCNLLSQLIGQLFQPFSTLSSITSNLFSIAVPSLFLHCTFLVS